MEQTLNQRDEDACCPLECSRLANVATGATIESADFARGQAVIGSVICRLAPPLGAEPAMMRPL